MALGGQLFAAAKPHNKSLSKNIAKALGAFDAQHTALTAAIRDQILPKPAGDVDTVQLDRNLDSCA